MRRHQQSGLARPDHLAAARHIGGDDRPAARGGLDQRLRHALAIGRGQYRDRGAAPYRADILDPTEPFDPRLGGQRRQFRVGERIAIVGIGRTGKHQLDRHALRAQPAHRGDRIGDALAAQHPGDERDRDGRSGRLGQRGEMVGVDPRAADQHDPLLSNPEPGKRGTVLGVLHDDPAVASRLADGPAQGGPHPAQT